MVFVGNKTKTRDQYLQNWHSLVEMSSSGKSCKLFKQKFEQNKYFLYLPNRYCKILVKFRMRNTRNTNLSVEIGRWNGTPLGDRTCTPCHADVGDEYHYILPCKFFKEIRSTFIPQSYFVRSNTQKFKNLMNSETADELRKLCQFINIVNASF